MVGVWTSFSFIPALLLSISRISNFLPSSVFLRLISFMLFLYASVWENALAWVPNFLQPYVMVLDFFRQCNFMCTICIRSEKLDILTHYSPPEPLNSLTDGPSGFFVPALLKILAPLFLPPSSVSLSCFILAVPMRECSGKHSCTSSTFPIAMLNGTLFFSRNDMIEMVEEPPDKN